MRVTQFIPRQRPGVKDQCLHYYTIEVLSAVCNCMRKLSFPFLHTCVSSKVTHKPPDIACKSFVSVCATFLLLTQMAILLVRFFGIRYYPFWTTKFFHLYDKGFLHKLSDTLYFYFYLLCHTLSLVIFVNAF